MNFSDVVLSPPRGACVPFESRSSPITLGVIVVRARAEVLRLWEIGDHAQRVAEARQRVAAKRWVAA